MNFTDNDILCSLFVLIRATQIASFPKFTQRTHAHEYTTQIKNNEPKHERYANNRLKIDWTMPKNDINSPHSSKSRVVMDKASADIQIGNWLFGIFMINHIAFCCQLCPHLLMAASADAEMYIAAGMPTVFTLTIATVG